MTFLGFLSGGISKFDEFLLSLFIVYNEFSNESFFELLPSIKCFGFIDYDYLKDLLTSFESKISEFYFFNGPNKLLFDKLFYFFDPSDFKVTHEEFRFDKFEASKF